MRSRSYLFLLAVLGLTILSGFLFVIRKPNYGIDVRGGVRLIYQMNLAELPQAKKNDVGSIRDREQHVLEHRVSGPLGATEGLVQVKGTDQFIIELPGETDIERAKGIIGTMASLKYYHAKNVSTQLVDRQYKEADRGKPTNPEVTFTDQYKDKEIGPTIGTGADKKPNPDYQHMIDGWDLILQGDELAQAMVQQQPGGGVIPALNFSPTGAKAMEKWCRRYQDRQEMLAAVLDGVVINISPLAKGAIISDRGVIEGDYDPRYVQNLVELLNSGSLPVKLDLVSSERVDPTIGRYALGKIETAGVGAFCVIGLFMLTYYVFPGAVAVVALILYMLFTLTMLKWGNATFSLAAIAGFVLSVGMAVDANILVFERVKEELRAGRPLDKAIDIGFRRALSAIVDSNTCTIITSLVLAYYGTGPVKGFATTLIIGVLVSLFTAVTVTRSLLVWLVGSGICNDARWFGLNRQWFGKFEKDATTRPLQIVNKCLRYFVISGLTIVPGIIFICLGGIKPNVEFQGGYQVEFKLDPAKSVSGNQMVADLAKAGMKGSNVQFVQLSSGERLADVTVPRSRLLKTDEQTAINTIATAAGFTKSDVIGSKDVGETIRAETVYNAVLGVIIASALIVIYLAIRFGVAVGGFVMGLKFSLSAIGALIHDICVVMGLAAVMGYLAGWEISSLFITAMLTMIGFSTHDTIVIFDRIRENLRRPHPNEEFGNLVNRSITQSFARSLNTSGTVIVTLAILIVAGSATMDLKFFNAAMLVGIISGTYSSIYNASPILYLWDKATGKRRGVGATLMAISEKEILHTRSTVSTVTIPEAAKTDAETAKGYGQVRRRRASAVQRSQRNIDDEL